MNSDTPFVERVLAEELERMLAGIGKEVEDPRHRLALVAMANDLAMLPLRELRGEATEQLRAALKAETLNRSLELRTRAETAAQRAWINTISRLLLGTITSGLA